MIDARSGRQQDGSRTLAANRVLMSATSYATDESAGVYRREPRRAKLESSRNALRASGADRRDPLTPVPRSALATSAILRDIVPEMTATRCEGLKTLDNSRSG